MDCEFWLCGLVFYSVYGIGFVVLGCCCFVCGLRFPVDCVIQLYLCSGCLGLVVWVCGCGFGLRLGLVHVF